MYMVGFGKQSRTDSCQCDHHLYSYLLFTVHTLCPLTQLIRSHQYNLTISQTTLMIQ